MNKNRRNRIVEIIDQINDVKNDIEDIISEERDAYDSLPESFQTGAKGDKIESAIAALDASNESLDKAIAKLNEAMK
jgi:hypothetical protein